MIKIISALREYNCKRFFKGQKGDGYGKFIKDNFGVKGRYGAKSA